MSQLQNMKEQNVRHRLADALEHCMKQSSLDRITVRQITDA